MAFCISLLFLLSFAGQSGALQSRITQKGIVLASRKHVALQPSTTDFISFADFMTSSAVPDGLKDLAKQGQSIDKKRAGYELLGNEQKVAPNNEKMHNSGPSSTASYVVEAKASLPESTGSANEKGADEAVDLGDGLQLWVTRKGDEKTFPKTGEQVAVHYTGYLPDGTSFDSSRDRGLFAFYIGRGEVIRGWDVGLRSMSLGERAVLKVPAEMAYGAGGQGPIPPNADLIFDVDLRGINGAIV
eukprot:TRINITY_DN5845_c2_g1_i1.p1 TRINITY_DN5845_c2_g1~~TRINITY_DN5845_c2_g1_i1.p1  ORF type:complete len:244 (-),score=39.88 TRINITY_DN5845_c2_g1_i1:60-791(-)